MVDQKIYIASELTTAWQIMFVKFFLLIEQNDRNTKNNCKLFKNIFYSNFLSIFWYFYAIFMFLSMFVVRFFETYQILNRILYLKKNIDVKTTI